MSDTMADLLKQARSAVSDNIVGPTKWPEMYESFVSQNASSVSQIESALRSLTYIIPGKTEGSKVTTNKN